MKKLADFTFMRCLCERRSAKPALNQRLSRFFFGRRPAANSAAYRTTSTVNTNQIKSIILLQNTRSVQEMESMTMRNASYLKFCTFLFQKQQKHDIKYTKNILKKHKNMFFKTFIKHKTCFFHLWAKYNGHGN